jgi:hypothetical protein
LHVQTEESTNPGFVKALRLIRLAKLLRCGPGLLAQRAGGALACESPPRARVQLA